MGHSCSRPEIRSRFRFTVSIAIAAASLVIGGALISCVGDAPADSSGNGNDGGGSDGTTTGDGSSSDGSTSGDGGPSNSTLTVAQDQDPTKGNINEILTIARIANEGSITGYNVYWATSTSTKLTQLTNIPKTGGNVTYTAVGAIPDTATQFLVFGANTDGTESQLAAAQIRDNFAIYIDITQNFDAGVGQYSIAVDQTNHKLDVVYAATVPGVVRCDLNDTTGSSCVYAPMPGTAGAGPGQVAPAVIDATNGKLILVQAYSRAATGSSLYARSCGLTDATGSTCVVTNISDSTAGTVENPSAFVDTSGHLVVATDLGSNIDVTRCNLGSTIDSCIHAQAANGGYGSAAFDSVTPSYVVAARAFPDNQPEVLGFNPTNIDFDQDFDAGAGQPLDSTQGLSLAIDVANRKSLVASDDNANNDSLALFRCNLGDTTGASCTYKDISAGQSSGCGTSPSAVVDAADKKLFVVTNNAANSNKLGLFRCDLDGSNCTYVDFSVGQGMSSGTTPIAAIDTTSNRLLVVTNNQANSDKPGVFEIGLW